MFRLVCITKLKLLALYLRSLCKQYTAIAIRVGSKIATCKNTQYFFFHLLLLLSDLMEIFYMRCIFQFPILFI